MLDPAPPPSHSERRRRNESVTLLTIIMADTFTSSFFFERAIFHPCNILLCPLHIEQKYTLKDGLNYT
jgi:hypothetical protein